MPENHKEHLPLDPDQHQNLMGSPLGEASSTEFHPKQLLLNFLSNPGYKPNITFLMAVKKSDYNYYIITKRRACCRSQTIT